MDSDDGKPTEHYIGLCETTFKTRYNSHTCSFRHEEKRGDTKLSQHIWSLKEKGIKYTIKFRIVDRARSYSPNSKICNLCITEKFYIITKPYMATLNKRNELGAQCRHKSKYLICNG